MHILTERKLSRQTPVYDHAGHLLYRADRDKARELLARPTVNAIGNTKRIRALQFQGPDPAHLQSGSHHRRPIGSPHRNESYWNVRGVWYLDRIPLSYRIHFQAVLLDCRAA